MRCQTRGKLGAAIWPDNADLQNTWPNPVIWTVRHIQMEII